MVGFPPIAAARFAVRDCDVPQNAPDPYGSEARMRKPNNAMSIGTILLVVFVLLLIGAIPSWPHSRSWGYYPSGAVGFILLILIILLLLGKI
jgi:hypothetical protein